MTPGTGFRLSSQQERIWTHQAERDTVCWTDCEVLLEGPLDVSRLHETIRTVVTGHEILRTIFHQQAGLKLPFQVILDDAAFVWHSVDLRSLDPDTQRTKIQDCLHAQRQAADLELGPLLITLLATLESEKYLFVIGLPALCADVQSLRTLIEDICRCYRAGQGESIHPAEVFQYADVAEWQDELLTSEETRAGRDFWREYSRTLDFESGVSVLSRFERKSGGRFVPDVVTRRLDASVSDNLRKVCSACSASIADGLLACWKAFLARITGQTSLLIACAASGRTHPELQGAIGPFAKYLPIQFTLDLEMPFSELLEQTTCCLAGALGWQDSFAWSHMKPAGAERQAVTLPVAFDYGEFGPGEFCDGVRFTVLRQEEWTELSTIRLAARRIGESLTLRFSYDGARLERETVERWSDHYVTLLAAASERPDTSIGRLPLLSEMERHRILTEWNRTEADYPRERSIHELFEAQVVRTPERIAVQSQDARLSYRELNDQANRLARHLRSLGVGAKSLVALRMERGAEMIVGLLAILKAAGAYVPLSLANPRSRLAQQLQGTAALITERSRITEIPEYAGPIICPDSNEPGLFSESATNPGYPTKPSDLCYVIYTSGSTGVPKGVGVRHRNLVNYSWFVRRLLNLTSYPEGLHFGVVSELSADLGNTCIFPSLISGGCLHLIAADICKDGQRFREYATRNPIDVLKIVPSHLESLLDTDGDAKILPRKYLVIGGESLPVRLLEKIRSFNPGGKIINHYGPTETTVGSLTQRVTEYDRPNACDATIPIGRPIANTRIYILDPRREIVPVGVTGELYIAGDGVSAGYINQPERTAERFFTECFNDDPGRKMYRTGDLARYRPDGTVEFIGRTDDQVKIRGFRIELGEVESALARYEGVTQAVVVARLDERGDRRLLAYVAAKNDPAKNTSGVTSEVLRAWLRGQLPEYMLPVGIVVLPRLPMTANGKIDRQNLPDPAETAAQNNTYIAPRNAMETAIARIWEEILHLDRVGVTDNFFEIGGHSLLATQVISRVRRSLDVDVPLRALFETPTVEALAKLAEKNQTQISAHTAPPITPAPRDRRLPLSFGQQRLWVASQLEPNSCRYSVPRAIRLTGILNAPALERALNDVVRRHEVLRTTYKADQGRPFQVIEPDLTIDLASHDLRSLSAPAREQEASRILEDQAGKPFDLEHDPLLRARLLRLDSEDHILFLNTHHIASDGWSFGVLQRDLAAFYSTATGRDSTPLPDLQIQYADYAVWQRNWMQGNVLEEQLAYWRAQLDGAAPLLALPTDRPRLKVQSHRGGVHQVLLPNSVAEPIRSLSRQEGATVYMTLFATFQCLMSYYSGSTDIVVGTDLAGRNDPRTEDLIGFFVNLLALRTDFSGDPSFQECISRVRDTALEAFAHSDVPFDKVVEDLRPKRDRAYSPIAQVLFSQRTTPRGASILPGVVASNFALKCNAIFDLNVSFADIAQGFALAWTYNSDLFDATTVARMATLYRATLENVSVHPGMKLSELTRLLSKCGQQISPQAGMNEPEDLRRQEEVDRAMFLAV
jgi:amino acid adenylation domain-containing protein